VCQSTDLKPSIHRSDTSKHMVAWVLLLLWAASLSSIPQQEVPWSIIGGEPVKSIRQFPWTTVLKMNGQAVCGGSMISSYAIITAARK
jgi:hypothetical protein